MHYMSSAKRIAAIHDLSGFGRVSLTVVIPILASMGFEVCPMPTAILSNHTQYPDYSFLDLTEEMPKFIEMWKKRGAQFDAIYSGYLGSSRQVRIVEDVIREFRREQTIVVVDPVLGDDGHLYSGITQELVREMRGLITKADIITPNFTELFALLDRPYSAVNSDEALKKDMLELSERGPDTVIITSVPVASRPGLTSTYAYSREGGRFWKVTAPYMPAHYPGTGDAFTSVVTGAIMQGDSLPVALDRAQQFILQGIRSSFGHNYDAREGFLLEKVLPNLAMPIQMETYELL